MKQSSNVYHARVNDIIMEG